MIPIPSPRVAIPIFLIGLVLSSLFIFLWKQDVEVVPTEVPEEVVEEEVVVSPVYEIIGTSVEGRDIEVYRFGTGDTHLLFVGGIHGGYEWNSVVLAYTFIDYLRANPDVVPEALTISVVPSANPDGVFAVVGKEGRFTPEEVPIGVSTAPGRFNARGVDLNRNFACKWKPESTWRGSVVSAGTSAFSEPEAVAIRDYVLAHTPDAGVFWHSQSDAVYGSECHEGILSGTVTLMNTYAGATGYAAIPTFDAYEITGDVEGWLASIGVPAITVELKTHTDVEWERNLLGIQALFSEYSK